MLSDLMDRIERDGWEQTVRLAEWVESVDPVPLDRVEADHRPGVYVMTLFAGIDVYEGLVGTGHPIYIGKAAHLDDRLGRQLRNCEPVRNLRPCDIGVVPVALPSHADAVGMEDRLMKLYRPVWNQSFCSGFGSKPQGANRKTQSPSRWDTLHPGRNVGNGDPRWSVEQIASLVRDHCAGTATQVRRWRLHEPCAG